LHGSAHADGEEDPHQDREPAAGTRRYRAATEALARAVNALTAENDTFRKELGKTRSSMVTTPPKRP
jgi:hypothetical protein